MGWLLCIEYTCTKTDEEKSIVLFKYPVITYQVSDQQYENEETGIQFLRQKR